MPMNRVQFQPGLSMREFLSLYGTGEQCEAALIARCWPRPCENCSDGPTRARASPCRTSKPCLGFLRAV